MTTCDDLPVPKPATGKTPVRNVRVPDDVWLPALARAEMEGRSVTDAIVAALRAYVAEPVTHAYGFSFANWPDAVRWAQSVAPAFAELRAELDAASVGLPPEWLEVAAWLAVSHHPGDIGQQQRVITGHMLRRVMADDNAPWRDRYRDSRQLSDAVQAIVGRHLPIDGR